MFGVHALLALTLIIALYGVVELTLHRRRLARIPVRIHVNGTRGKSSVTRLVAAGLRAAGIRTCAKTTGTLARMILPDGRELPVFRPAGANVREQIRIVDVASSVNADALVIECMALQPELQWLCESKFVRATHAVITNARPDHLDVMGPNPHDVALALAGMVPVGGTLYSAEGEWLSVLQGAAADRRCRLVPITPTAIDAVGDADMAGFRYLEHRENVATALRVCEDLGVARATALSGMWAAEPDPGAMTERCLEFFGRQIVFVNGFAANDPVSTEQIWNMVLQRHQDIDNRIAVLNCRADRPDRSMQLGKVFPRWTPPQKVVVVGTGTNLFAREAVAAGMDPTQIVFAEAQPANEVFETILSLVQDRALVMGMGNIGGIGLEVVRYFHNRSKPIAERAA